jgi:drug/metabolite transporter (DMT)-like permease
MSTAALPHPRMTPVEWGLLLALSLLWGGSFFFNGIMVRDLPPAVIVAGRVTLAAIILNSVLALRGERLPLSRPAIVAFLGMGLLNNVVPFTLIVWGQGHIASGIAAILNATTPLFSVVLAHVLTPDEKMTGRRVVGVIAGIVGVAIMMGPAILAGLGANLVGEIAVLGAALSYGFANVFGRRFRRLGVTPMVSATGQVTASSAILLPIVLATQAPWDLPMPSPATIAALVAIAALSTALAYVIFFRILSTAGATNLSLVTLLVPVSALILGVLFLHEQIDAHQIIGILVIAIGLAAIDGRLIDLLARRQPA